MIKFTREDFMNTKGIDLEARLPNNDNPSKKTEVFIDLVCELIEVYIKDRNLKYDPLTLEPAQIEAVKKACMFQAEYILANGHLGIDSGYDPISRTIVDLSSKVVCSLSIVTLSAYGLLYRGL